MAFDIILEEIGDQNRFQFLTMLLSILGKTFCAFQILIPVFINYKQPYFCIYKNNSDIRAVSHCELYNETSRKSFPCTAWRMNDTLFTSTTRSQYQLYCDRETLTSLSSTVYMLGMFFGCTLYGLLSDRIGRLKSIMIATLNVWLFGLAAAFCKFFWLYNILRFFAGFGAAGMMSVLNTYAVEIVTLQKRIQFMMLCFNGWAFGSIFLVLIAYFERSHFNLQIMIACLSGIVLLYPMVLPESPRWLLARGDKKRAYESCCKIAKINGRRLLEEQFRELSECTEKEDATHEVSWKKLLIYPNLRKITLVIWFCYAVAAFVYYILSLGSGNIGGNVFLNLLLMGALEFPARLFVVFFGNKFGRVPIISISFVGAGIFILICAPIYKVKSLESLLITLSMLSRILIGVAFDLIWLYALEIFPTIVRTTGVGSASTWARVGSLLSPQLEPLAQLWLPLPFVLSGIFPVIAGVLSWIIFPETTRMETKDFIEEGESYIATNTQNLLSDRLCCCKRNADRENIQELEINT